VRDEVVLVKAAGGRRKKKKKKFEHWNRFFAHITII
jgi:hypothetical protein